MCYRDILLYYIFIHLSVLFFLLFAEDRLYCIDMKENERVTVVEQDNGDGWLMVTNSRQETGLVPSTYVQIHKRYIMMFYNLLYVS